MNLRKKLFSGSARFVLVPIVSILIYGLYDSNRFASQNVNLQRANKLEDVSNNLYRAKQFLSFRRIRVGQGRAPMIGRIVTYPPSPERARFYLNESINVLGDEGNFDDTLRFVYNSLLDASPLDPQFTNQVELIKKVIKYANGESSSARHAFWNDLQNKYRMINNPSINDIFICRF